MAVDDNDHVEDFPLPNFEERKDDDPATDIFGKPANWYNSKYQEPAEPEEEEPQPLTLEDIEAIRVSAYEDGFNEGKEAGFIKGVEEGKLQGLSEGHQEGLKQGFDEGLKEGQVNIDAQTLHWQQLVSRLHRPLEKLDDSVEFQLVKLATSLAEQMVRCEVTVNPQVVLQALKQATEALPASNQTLVISFHPDDLAFVQDAFSEEECKKRSWDLRSEPTLLRGDCHVQTNTSSIDYTFATRVEQVLSHFLKENYQHMPDVTNDVDISHDQAVDYEMVTEQTLKEQAELAEQQAQADTDNTAESAASQEIPANDNPVEN
jgi:flagellar assembly protein FliH